MGFGLGAFLVALRFYAGICKVLTGFDHIWWTIRTIYRLQDYKRIFSKAHQTSMLQRTDVPSCRRFWLWAWARASRLIKLRV